MPLTAEEKDRVRYHLGYTSVQPAAAIDYGIIRPVQTAFLVELAMTNLLEEALPRVRRYLTTLDELECLLAESAERLAARRLGDIELRDSEPDLIEREYDRWTGRLADVLGVPRYGYSSRNRPPGAGPGQAGNIPVRG